KRGFRWRVPRLPSTDSIEFTFRAVNPPSEDYEVALYGTDRVVIEKSKGEPTTKKVVELGHHVSWATASAALIASLVAVLSVLVSILLSDKYSKATTLNESGCSFMVVSSFERFTPEGQNSWPWSPGPW